MSHFITPQLPKNLPENWTVDQYVAPEGSFVGLSEQHGFNYLCRQVNNAQTAALELSKVAAAAYDNLLDNWHLAYPINTSEGYCVVKSTTYYKDAERKTAAGTLTTAVAVQYVNSSYGIINLDGTEYYVPTTSLYQGYPAETTPGFTFDRWWAKDCTVFLSRTGKGIRLTRTNGSSSGTFRQAILNAAQLSSKQATLSVFVDALSGSCNLRMYTSETMDAATVTQVSGSSVALKTGLNSVTVTLPSNLGTSKYTHLFVAFEVAQGADITIQAVKLQLGPTQTLGYMNDSSAWRLTQVPHQIIEYLKCVGAPVEFGGNGSVLTLAASTANTLVNAEVIE